jgi:hypothetical protein
MNAVPAALAHIAAPADADHVEDWKAISREVTGSDRDRLAARTPGTGCGRHE